MAHDFAEKEIRPVAWEYDRDGTWPEEILRKAWELGLMNGHTPEEYGGRDSLPRGLHRRGGALVGLLGHRDLDRRQRPRPGAPRAGRL
jgi:alkylation response protein AidB-like acyl-CoA dehydrogenase